MDLLQIITNIGELWSTYWRIFLFEGVKNTLILTVIAVVLGVLLGTLVAMAKMSKSRIVRFLISIYIEIIRGTPILLQLYIFYFVLPDKYYFSVMRHERTIMLVTMLLLFSGALDTVLGTVTGGVMTLFNFMIGLVPFL